MITVYGAMPAWGLPDMSPPCLKLKTYLRMAGLPFRSAMGDPRVGPTKKIPYADPGDGTRVGDSERILRLLKERHGDPLDARLGPREHAVGRAVRHLCENGIYWAIIQARWLEDEGAPHVGAAFAPVLPPVVGPLVFRLLRRAVRQTAWGQGSARLPVEDVYAFANRDLDAVAELLGDGPYLFGDAPTSYDACVFGHVANAMAFPVASPLREHARSLAPLVAFRDRVLSEYWADAC